MTGTLSMSVEVELGWGSVMKPEKRRYEQFDGVDREAESAALLELLETCEAAGIPISFNIVGHLFQEECDHADAPHRERWFEIDPGTDASSDPLFYAPDMVDAIKESPVDHEICTHTFSHVRVDEVDENVLRWELEKCFDQHRAAGLPKPMTLITPYNRPPPPDTLRDCGITAIREPATSTQGMSSPEKLLWYMTRDPSTKPPEIVDGLTRVYTSTGISLATFTLEQGSLSPHPAFRLIPASVRKRAHKRYLKKSLAAVKRGEHVHLWCHVYDLANDIQMGLVTSFLMEVGQLLKEDEISVKTIKQIDEELRA